MSTYSFNDEVVKGMTKEEFLAFCAQNHANEMSEVDAEGYYNKVVPPAPAKAAAKKSDKPVE